MATRRRLTSDLNSNENLRSPSDGRRPVLVGGGGKDYAEPRDLLLHYANRHGLITGATGTGKTVTLQVLAEGLSAAGVPVFSGRQGRRRRPRPAGRRRQANSSLKRAGADRHDATSPIEAFPVVFWDLFGKEGHPVRATVSEMGPLLLARLMELNDTQEGVLNIAFKVADEEGLLLLDLKDLQALLAYVADSASESTTTLRQRLARRRSARSSARCSSSSSRAPTSFFGEPALDIADLMRTDARRPGRHQRPRRRQADAVAARSTRRSCSGCCRSSSRSCPRSATPTSRSSSSSSTRRTSSSTMRPKALVEKVEQVVRLIRSKGVGVYFVHAEPARRPRRRARPARQPRPARAPRLHAARAKAVEAGRRDLPPQPRLRLRDRHQRARHRRGLVSMLEAKGVPSMVSAR